MTRRFIVSTEGDVVEVREVIVTAYPTLDDALAAVFHELISWAPRRYI